MTDIALHDEADAPAPRFQLAVLGALAVVYVVMAAFWVPPHNRLLLPVGVAAMLAAGGLGRRLGPGNPAANEPVFAWIALFTLILLPVTLPPSPRGRGFVTGFLGVFCALGFWAVFRYPTRPGHAARRSLARDLRWGVGWGVVLAIGLSLLALVIAAFAAVVGVAVEPADVGWVLAGYGAGGVATGAVVGLGRPLAQWPLGSMLLGIPGAMAAYGAVGLAMGLAGEGAFAGAGAAESMSVRDWLMMIVAIGVAGGPMFGLAARRFGAEPLDAPTAGERRAPSTGG